MTDHVIEGQVFFLKSAWVWLQNTADLKIQLFTSRWKLGTVLPLPSQGLKCVSLRPQVIPDALTMTWCMERPLGCLSSPTAGIVPQMLKAKALGAGQERAGPQSFVRAAMKV